MTSGGTVVQPSALFGWGVLLFMLVTAADFDATASLAQAFAFLILLATLLSVGPVAFDNIAVLVGASRSATAAPSTDSRFTGFTRGV